MAMNNLGTMYMEGCGVRRSDRWAKYWFEKAVARECVFAMVNLANMLTLGPKKYRDYNRAVELLKMAQELFTEAEEGGFPVTEKLNEKQ